MDALEEDMIKELQDARTDEEAVIVLLKTLRLLGFTKLVEEFTG